MKTASWTDVRKAAGVRSSEFPLRRSIPGVAARGLPTAIGCCCPAEGRSRMSYRLDPFNPRP